MQNPCPLCAKCHGIHTKLSQFLSRKFTPADLTTNPKTYPVIFWKTMPGETDLSNLYLFCRRAERMLVAEAKVSAVVWTSIFTDKGGAGTKTVKVLVDFAESTAISEDMSRRLFEGVTVNVGVELPETLEAGKLATHASLVRLEFFNEMNEVVEEGRLLNPDHSRLSIAM